MIHLIKKSGERFVYDSGSGAVSPVSALQFKMLSYLTPPMTEDVPTALRYDLAKYDGGAVSDAYEGLYALYTEGKLFSPESSENKCEGCWAARLCALNEKSPEACALEEKRIEAELISE